MSDNNPDLAAQEVDEELRRDQLNALWKTYGKYIIGGAVGIVLAVAGNEIYTSQVESGQEANARQFEAANSGSTVEGANAAAVWAETVPTLSGGYAALAELRLAQELSKAGDIDGAVAAYDSVAAQGAHDVVLTDFAKLMAALLIAEKKADLDTAYGRLSVIASKGMPWYYSALEQLAFIDMQKGRSTDAHNKFLLLAGDTETPQSISTRAAQFRDLLEEQQRAATLTQEAPSDEQPAGESSEG